MARRQTETMRQQRRRQRQVTKRMIRLTKLALRRPVTIILCLITIAYFGFQSVMGMKLELTPEMEMPMLIIATVYPGASPEDVTDLVTKKEEDAITSLDSVDKVQSISRENVSIVIVQYEYGTNMDTAYINLKKGDRRHSGRSAGRCQ